MHLEDKKKEYNPNQIPAARLRPARKHHPRADLVAGGAFSANAKNAKLGFGVSILTDAACSLRRQLAMVRDGKKLRVQENFLKYAETCQGERLKKDRLKFTKRKHDSWQGLGSIYYFTFPNPALRKPKLLPVASRHARPKLLARFEQGANFQQEERPK